MDNEKNWLLYYKNSLFDSENLAIDISRIKNLYYQNNSDLSTPLINAKQAEELLNSEERRINRLRGVTKKDSSRWQEFNETEILIAPFYLEHHSNDPKFKQRIIHPFWITATVDRSGQLSAPKDLFPLIVRNYLTPIADTKNDFVFSSIHNVTLARDLETPESDYEHEKVDWNVYWDYLNGVFSAITHSSIYTYRTEKYTTQRKLTYFAVSSKISTAKSILFLYDNLLNETEELPLLSKIIHPANRLRRPPITDEGFLHYNHLHLGQMSNEFPLSISQRKTLLSYLTAEEKPVLAVNGPPGTGKTTLLQSLVATEFVKAAIIGEEPPLILACSNNNQAVTNIIDSFINSVSTLENLAERWIPNFQGYATYLPSNTKGEKSLQDINFLKGNLFGYEGTLCELENEQYLHEAEYYFLEKFNTYFNLHENSLEEACYHLQQEIIHIEDVLIDSVRFSNDYIISIDYINNLVIHKEDLITNKNITITKLHQWRSIISELKSLYKEPNFIQEIQVVFKSSSDALKPTHLFKIDNDKLEDIHTALSYIKQLLAHINQLLQTNLKLTQWKQQNNIKGQPFTSEEQMWNYEYEKIKNNDKSHRFFYDEIDVTLRHSAFLLATHYWEARWLLETFNALEYDTEKGTGEKAIKAQWKRRAMLTPCFVATFYMAPSHFVYSQFQGANEEGRPVFEYLPLYNFIDLLIIDEAGQVTPEVSIPIFSLAQKAFVVGDLKQIEPIWSIPPKIDLGNLTSLHIIDDFSENTFLNDLGFLASSGSIMKMAQNACEYETPLHSETENGLILLEHRRCNDEIIGFCNELAYGGILKPMKGKADDSQIFPSMMAYHVEGVSERKYNSRCNLDEVKAIIQWLQQHKEEIQQAYNVDTIEEVLGIITPFASQKGELSKALTEAGYDINNIKLGTVHALQGAERNIILFSSVYSNNDEGTLFFDKDNKPNMLNVAVSRAKDSFILFGDTRIFDETKNTPSGLLKKHLNIYEMVN
ncbi:AAA domain-containing protein [Tenacibaculum sp. TC6]|uniref:DEAD/DEAH box helicase n=1 Tax=Tenacibaculum sp. TC6 TaxID=3423223 RepID=UPI003D35ED20